MDCIKCSPYAWRKMQFLRDIGDTEVSFMAITPREQLNLIVDVRMPKQTGFSAYTEFDEEGLADFFEDMVDEGLHPEQFGRIWCHTHPGNSASPSMTDEETFKREFSAPNWGVMFILAKDNSWTCKLRYKCHPDLHDIAGGSHLIKAMDFKVDWTAYCPEFNCESTNELWKAEYEKNFTKGTYRSNYSSQSSMGSYGTGLGQTNTDYRSCYGPGWRKRGTSWFYSDATAKEDRAKGLMYSPDSTFHEASHSTQTGGLSSQAWRERFDRDDEERKSPLSYYRPETNNRGKLTKREKKYLKKHGTLLGFVPPINTGNGKQVPIQRLEASRNLLDCGDDERTEQGDTLGWLEEAHAIQKGETIEFPGEPPLTEYEVTMDDGFVFSSVWAESPEEAIKIAEKMHQSAIVIGPEPSRAGELGPPDDDREPTDEELQAIELEEQRQKALDNDDTELELLPTSEDTVNEGLKAYSEMEADFAPYHVFD